MLKMLLDAGGGTLFLFSSSLCFIYLLLRHMIVYMFANTWEYAHAKCAVFMTWG
jgi:hypothetical protein